MNRMTSDNTLEMNMLELALNQVYIGEDGWVRYRNGPEDEVSACDLIRTAAEALDVELPILSDDDLSDLMTDWLQYGAEEPEGVLAILYRALWAMAEVRGKLSRYEDTGLEPKEVSEYQHLCDSYVEAGLDSKFVQFCIDATQNGLSMNHICELAQAEKDGRLVVPPCKVGDFLYEVDLPKYGVITCKVLEIHTYFGPLGHAKGNPMVSTAVVGVEVVDGHGKGSGYTFETLDFGENIFLTREEAEAALKKRGTDNEKS